MHVLEPVAQYMHSDSFDFFSEQIPHFPLQKIKGRVSLWKSEMQISKLQFVLKIAICFKLSDNISILEKISSFDTLISRKRKEMKGLTTQNEIKMLQGLGVDLSNVIVRRDEASCKWFIEIHVCIPDQEEQIYFLERVRGGRRVFAHLEDAVRQARSKFGEIKHLQIEFDDIIFTMDQTDGKDGS